MASDMNRRTFLGAAATATAAAFTIVPRHVLGGEGQVAPSEKIAFAYIGCGTQGLSEMMGMLAMPEVQIVAVCDPNKDTNDYVWWGRDGIRNAIATAIGKPDWRQGMKGHPGGRDVGKEAVELYYAGRRASDRFKGCASYADFRELLDKEKGFDAVKIMTPDHLHATIAIAAMKKGKHVLVHKPLANRLTEARWVIDTARRTKVATHFLPASPTSAVGAAAAMIRDGAVGTLREIHNWTNRPVWPQYPTVPTDKPPVPKDFDWDLWLGPATARPYHPHYTHAVFRGWYEFGGGSIADMGHYSLWPVFREFNLDSPVSVESTPSHVCTITPVDNVSTVIANDYSFPVASTMRFRFAAKGDRPAIDLVWHEGGMRPPTPPEMEEDQRQFEPEGMMFVGDKGKIVAGFRGENPQIVPQRKAREFAAARGAAVGARAGGAGGAGPEAPARGGRGQGGGSSWIAAFRGGPPTYGDFLLAGPISDTVNLGAISLRLGGKRLLWDAENMKITNLPSANKHLYRDYRPGWDLKP